LSAKWQKLLKSQMGFTLVELMTVLIILGVIMGIGVPKYLRIQSQAEYDADVTTIENIVKAAEIYATQKNLTGDILLTTLITNKIVDGEIILNRRNSGDANKTSVKNDTVKLSSFTTVKFVIDSVSGQVSESEVTKQIETMIGKPVY